VRNGGVLHVTVRRADIVNDSYAKLGQLKGRQLLVGFRVNFLGEEAIDAGGVTRDGFASFLRMMFNPNYALFELSANGRSSQINPANPVIRSNYREFYRFTGRMIARAVIRGVTIDAYITRLLLKHLLEMPMRLSDLADGDDEFHGSLEYILKNEPEELHIAFVAHIENCGVVTAIDLIENGRNVEVTIENRESRIENRQEYVNLMVEHHLKARIKEQVSHFCQGFHEMIFPKELSWFTPDELDLLICGLPEVNVNDLKMNCKFIHLYNFEHQIIQKFF
jgi:hypothetical protein